MEEGNKTQLTEAELELMLVLWKLGEATVHDVLEVVSAQKAMAYTTASTIIRILEKKGFVASRKAGKTHIYSPLLTKKEYEARTLGLMVGKLFDNTPVALVARLIDDNKLTPDEIAELKKLLNKKR